MLMGELGEALGILTVLLLTAAILNFFIKWGNRNWVMKLPKESKFRTAYQTVMKFLVKNHRFFGIGAAVVMVAHVIMQIIFRWVSVTGLIAAGLALVTITLGIVLFQSKKRTPAMLWAHRGSAIVLTLAIVTHLISKR